LPIGVESIMGSLFSFSKRAILRAGMYLLILFLISTTSVFPNIEASTQQEPSINVTMNNVHDAVPNSLVSIDLEITWPDSLDTLSVDGFSFAVAYDTLVLQLYNVFDNGLIDSCKWFFAYKQDSINESETPNMLLWLVGDDTSHTDCFVSGERTITLQFRTKDDPSLYGTSTNLDFYWEDCHDNIFWTSDPDTAILALKVFDAEGLEITNQSHSLPSFTGPHLNCIDPTAHDGAAVVTSVRFQNGKIVFKAPTDVNETLLDE